MLPHPKQIVQAAIPQVIRLSNRFEILHLLRHLRFSWVSFDGGIMAGYLVPMQAESPHGVAPVKNSSIRKFDLALVSLLIAAGTASAQAPAQNGSVLAVALSPSRSR